MIEVVNDSVNAYFNLALEEYLLKEFDPGEDIFLLWRNSPAIIVGRNQNTWDEINHEFVRENKIAVVRRLTGGGAVYHDLGNLNFTFITRGQKKGHRDFESFARPIVTALRSLGVAAEFAGRNDILVGGRKVSGNAQYHFGDSVLHHGTLLFDSDMNNLARALHISHEKLASKGVASVRSRVTNIKKHLPCPLEMKEFQAALGEALSRIEGEPKGKHRLTKSDLARVGELVKAKYGTWHWNYGASPGYDLRNSRRFAWGKLDVLLGIKEGVIVNCKIYGDFFGKEDISGLEKCLVSLPFQEKVLRQALERTDLSSYVSGLDLDSLVELMTNSAPSLKNRADLTMGG